MCGRFALFSHMKVLMERFGITRVEFDPGQRYNVAPEEQISIIIQEEDDRRIVAAKWGLVPFWSKKPETEYSTINARAETLHARPTFRHSLEKRRCLIPVDGFYEWAGKKGKKTPYFIHEKDHQPIAFAGLYDVWHSPDGDQYLLSAAIVTTTPNAVMWPIHNRMPVVLSREEEGVWLDASIVDFSQIRPMMDPAPDDTLEAHVVSTYVNDPSHKGSQCIEPVPTLDDWLS